MQALFPRLISSPERDQSQHPRSHRRELRERHRIVGHFDAGGRGAGTVAGGLLAVRRVKLGHVALSERGPWVPTVGVPLPEAGAGDVAEQTFSGENRLTGDEQVLPSTGLQEELCHLGRHRVLGSTARTGAFWENPSSCRLGKFSMYSPSSRRLIQLVRAASMVLGPRQQRQDSWMAA